MFLLTAEPQRAQSFFDFLGVLGVSAVNLLTVTLWRRILAVQI
jgi:hypothetical protein